VTAGDALPAVQTVTLLVLLAAFVGLVLWLLRPGARAEAQRAAEIPFREDAPAPASRRPEGA
jgi:cytochrome c oxidase cbb3-type subunit IV